MIQGTPKRELKSRLIDTFKKALCNIHHDWEQTFFVAKEPVKTVYTCKRCGKMHIDIGQQLYKKHNRVICTVKAISILAISLNIAIFVMRR